MSAQNKEFRIKGGHKIIGYIKRFSSTEKFFFSIFFTAAFITAVIMAFSVNNLFTVEVPSYGGELREGVIGLPHTINPILAVTDIDKDISSLVYSGLMKYDGDNLVKDIAKSYTISSDGLTYDFILKEAFFQTTASVICRT